MPFTLSHAAAALPFRRFKPVWPALVIGTFAPDLQYFIQTTDEDRSGHHFPAVLLFTLPLAMLVLWLFEKVVKGPAIELLPTGWQRRLQGKTAPLSFSGWRQIGRILFWIAVGTLTHLIWDQFTHSYTRVANWWPLLTEYVNVPFWHRMAVAGILQDASSVLGLLAVCLWLAAWYQRTPPVTKSITAKLSPATKIWVASTIGFAALAGGYVLASHALADRVEPVGRAIRAAITIISVIQLFCVEMLIYGAAMTWRSRQHIAGASKSAKLPARSG